MYHCAQLLPVWPGWGRVGPCGRSQTWWVGVWGILMGCTAFMPNQRFMCLLQQTEIG